MLATTSRHTENAASPPATAIDELITINSIRRLLEDDEADFVRGVFNFLQTNFVGINDPAKKVFFLLIRGQLRRQSRMQQSAWEYRRFSCRFFSFTEWSFGFPGGLRTG